MSQLRRRSFRPSKGMGYASKRWTRTCPTHQTLLLPPVRQEIPPGYQTRGRSAGGATLHFLAMISTFMFPQCQTRALPTQVPLPTGGPALILLSTYPKRPACSSRVRSGAAGFSVSHVSASTISQTRLMEVLAHTAVGESLPEPAALLRHIPRPC